MIESTATAGRSRTSVAARATIWVPLLTTSASTAIRLGDAGARLIGRGAGARPVFSENSVARNVGDATEASPSHARPDQQHATNQHERSPQRCQPQWINTSVSEARDAGIGGEG